MLDLNASSRQQMTSQQVQLLRLYEVDYNPPSDPLRITNWTGEISLDSNIYTPFPVKDTGIRLGSGGKVKPVTLTIGNIDGSRTIQGIIEDYDLVGKNVTITRMMNNTNDPIPTTYKITAIKAKKGTVAFTLSIGVDVLASTVPARQIYRESCRWMYSGKFKGSECQYSGSDTECDYTFDECRSKGNLHHFGGFPGTINHNFIF